MGDMADLYGYWATASGIELKITEMETEHIRNTVNMIKQKFPHDDYMLEYLQKFETELSNREGQG